MRRYECSYRRWHVHRVTKRPRYVPIRSGTLPVTWCGWPVIDGSTSRGCLVAMLGPWGLMRGVGDPLGCPWSRGPYILCTPGPKEAEVLAVLLYFWDQMRANRARNSAVRS